MSRHWPRARIMRAMRARVQAHAENGVMTKTTNADPAHPALKPATRLVVGGRDPAANHGFVNPPVHHVSTVLYPTAEDFLARRARYLYGRRGTPTSEALEDALRALERGNNPRWLHFITPRSRGTAAAFGLL
jgi:O-acetylhomoserine/O-acetylserine sulfhydrylase-like pyridoxal-dependent enzyme